jgi:hypothetical protein
MNRRALFVCSLLLLVAPAGVAGQETFNSPDRGQVLQFLDLMHARSQMTVVLDGMAKQIRAGAEESFKKKVPDATPEQIAKLDKICDSMFASLSIDEFIDAIVPIYQKHLTKADLAAATAFYSSPAGQKILKELPSIMSESMQAGAEVGRKTMAAKSEDLDRQIADLVKESTNK